MNDSTKPVLFPGVTILSGIAGFSLRCWLFSAADLHGLLPKNHIAGTLSFVLLAVMLVLCLLEVRKAHLPQDHSQLFPPSGFAAAGTLIGALGMGYSAFTLTAKGFLQVIVPILGILSTLALVLSAYSRWQGLRPHCLLHGTVVIYLIFRTVAYCQVWGIESQLQLYFFELLACLLLLIACYYRTELDVHTDHSRQYVFFSQAALFCCCMSLIGKDWLFYLSSAIYLATDYCVIFPKEQDT